MSNAGGWCSVVTQKQYALALCFSAFASVHVLPPQPAPQLPTSSSFNERFLTSLFARYA